MSDKAKTTKDAGLVRVEVWVPRGQEGLVALYAEMIRRMTQLDQPKSNG